MRAQEIVKGWRESATSSSFPGLNGLHEVEGAGICLWGLTARCCLSWLTWWTFFMLRTSSSLLLILTCKTLRFCPTEVFDQSHVWLSYEGESNLVERWFTADVFMAKPMGQCWSSVVVSHAIGTEGALYGKGVNESRVTWKHLHNIIFITLGISASRLKQPRESLCFEACTGRSCSEKSRQQEHRENAHRCLGWRLQLFLDSRMCTRWHCWASKY